jgi:hypothetical protein
MCLFVFCRFQCVIGKSLFFNKIVAVQMMLCLLLHDITVSEHAISRHYSALFICRRSAQQETSEAVAASSREHMISHWYRLHQVQQQPLQQQH